MPVQLAIQLAGHLAVIINCRPIFDWLVNWQNLPNLDR